MTGVSCIPFSGCGNRLRKEPEREADVRDIQTPASHCSSPGPAVSVLSRLSVAGRPQLPPHRPSSWLRLPLCPRPGESLGRRGTGRPSAAPQHCDIISGPLPAQSRIQLSSPLSPQTHAGCQSFSCKDQGARGQRVPQLSLLPQTVAGPEAGEGWAACENEGLAKRLSEAPSPAPLRP